MKFIWDWHGNGQKSIAAEIGVSPCTVQQKIPYQNAKKFAYIKKLLYFCARNCKLGNCVTTGDQIFVLRDTIN